MFTLGCVYDNCLRVNWLLEKRFNFGQAVLAAIIVECLFFYVIENKAVVKYAHFQVGKAKVIDLLFWGRVFPVADCVIRDVADCSADKSELAVWNRLVFQEAL